MRKIKSAYLLLISFFVFLTLVFPALSQQPPTVIPPPAVADPHLKSLAEISAVSIAAIDASKTAAKTAESSVEHMQIFFSVVAVLITGIAGFIGFFGYKNIHDIFEASKKKYEAEADISIGILKDELKRKTEETERGLKAAKTDADETVKNMREEVARMKEHIAVLEIASVESFKEILTQSINEGINSQTLIVEVLHLVNAAQTLDDVERKTKYLEDALTALNEAISSAVQTKNIRLTVWFYSMRAYIHQLLGRLDEAVVTEEKAIELALDYINRAKMATAEDNSYVASTAKALEESLGDKYYNLACYYCRMGEEERGISNLSKAIAIDAKFKSMAKEDRDFKDVRTDEFQRLTE